MLNPLSMLVSAEPYLNDVNALLSMVTLEEVGATGNKGLIGLTANPVVNQAVAGLATSATAQASIEVRACRCT